MTGTTNITMELPSQGNGPVAQIHKKNRALPYIMCSLGAMFYLYEFVLQVSPSVMTSQLMRDLQLDAAGLGAMSAFYYYAYTPMQLPAGLLYDRFGPRILITIAVLICAAGACFFGLTHTIALASVGRFFMGIGSAFSFIGALILIARWFPAKQFAFLAGIVQLMSSIGAIAGQAPLAMAINTWGWRHTILWTSAIGLLLSILIWVVVRDAPADEVIKKTAPQKGELKRLYQVCGNRQTWFCGIYTFASWAPITAFAALWGVPFLATKYGISIQAASASCAMIWLGIGLASPAIGWWSDNIGKRNKPLTIAALIGIVAITAIIYMPVLPMPVLYGLLFFLGVAASGQALSFAVVKDNNPRNAVGTAIGFNNMATVAGGALFQPLVGLMLHFNWLGKVQAGVPVYSVHNYHIAFSVVPLCYVLAAVMSYFFIRETHCHSQFPH